MLLGYSFEPRLKSRALDIAGTVITNKRMLALGKPV